LIALEAGARANFLLRYGSGLTACPVDLIFFLPFFPLG